MKNAQFLKVIAQSFYKFSTTYSRSNEKLKILHGAIAKDIQNQLGKNYEIKAYNIGDGKEGKIQGRYLNKNVDVTILKDNVAIAGIGVKFVMQNYAQNSVNYLENMLGETANIRSNNIPYFQIFIIPDELPYYKSGGKFDHWEQFTQHNVKKYLILSTDNVAQFFHSPTKTLLFVVNLPSIEKEVKSEKDYIDYYLNLDKIEVKLSQNDYGEFQNSVIYNDYETYIDKVVHYIKAI